MTNLSDAISASGFLVLARNSLNISRILVWPKQSTLPPRAGYSNKHFTNYKCNSLVYGGVVVWCCIFLSTSEASNQSQTYNISRVAAIVLHPFCVVEISGNVGLTFVQYKNSQNVGKPGGRVLGEGT